MPWPPSGDLLALGGSREASPIAGRNTTSGRAQEASAQGIARAADSLNAPLSSASETETGPCPPWPSSNVLAASLLDRVLECNRRYSTISQSVNREKPGASEALQSWFRINNNDARRKNAVAVDSLKFWYTLAHELISPFADAF